MFLIATSLVVGRVGDKPHAKIGSNLIAAFLVVATGIVSLVVLGRWTIITVPVAPARYLYYAMFLGGPHGDPFAPLASTWWQSAVLPC